MKKIVLSMVILGGLFLNGFADEKVLKEKFLSIKIIGDIVIPIEGRKSRVDIDIIDIKINNECQISLPILAEYLNLRTHRYEPKELKVKCGEDVYEAVIYDADGAPGIKLMFREKEKQFERKMNNSEINILINKKLPQQVFADVSKRRLTDINPIPDCKFDGNDTYPCFYFKSENKEESGNFLYYKTPDFKPIPVQKSKMRMLCNKAGAKKDSIMSNKERLDFNLETLPVTSNECVEFVQQIEK